MLSNIRLLTKIKPYQWVVIIVLVTLGRMVYLRSQGYTWIDSGFEGKTFWDLAELLIIPGTLAVVAYILDKQERKADRELTQDNQREAALQNYFDAMTRLILDKELRKSGPEDDVRDIAQAKTLTTLERLDSDRKSKLVKFICDVGLVTGGEKTEPPIIGLRLANLTGARLGGAHLEGADLVVANLTGAYLGNAYLVGANLEGAHLEGANLAFSQLAYSYLAYSHLEGANLVGANLEGAHLEGAYLDEADLEAANLEGAHLEGAHLEKAKLESAIMPDGKKYDPTIHTIEKLTAPNLTLET